MKFCQFWVNENPSRKYNGQATLHWVSKSNWVPFRVQKSQLAISREVSNATLTVNAHWGAQEDPAFAGEAVRTGDALPLAGKLCCS